MFYSTNSYNYIHFGIYYKRLRIAIDYKKQYVLIY